MKWELAEEAGAWREEWMGSVIKEPATCGLCVYPDRKPMGSFKEA